MKILCVSDTIDPVVHSSYIKERFSDIDIILSAGDLPMEYLEFITDSLNKPLYFVFGNHNLGELGRFVKSGNNIYLNSNLEDDMFGFGSICLEDKVKKIKKVLIYGLGGSINYNNGKHQFTDFEIFLRILKIIPKLIFNKIFFGRYLDIFLTHSPPQNIHDIPEDPPHRGFKSFIWFLDKFKPSYMLHGHVHLYDLNANRTTHYNNTYIINVYKHYILETV